MKRALVTGASTGIGYASVARMLEAGWWVFATVRNDQDQARLEAELSSSGGKLSVLRLDVTDTASISALRASLWEALGPDGRLDGLVNNAGVALGGPLLHVDDALITRQFDH